MKNILLYLSLFISLSCICGMCNKDDDTPDDNGNNDSYVEPELKPEGKWMYMTSGSLPSFYGPVNGSERPLLRKWIASEINPTHAFKLSDSREYLLLSFENTDKHTRFLCDKLNPDGKETLSISLYSVELAKSPPQPGIFKIDNKNGFCSYNVYDANSNKVDSTRTLFQNSTFTVTKFEFVNTFGNGAFSNYLMSGTAHLQIMYWKSGTASTTDVHDLQCTFNNIPVEFKN